MIERVRNSKLYKTIILFCMIGNVILCGCTGLHTINYFKKIMIYSMKLFVIKPNNMTSKKNKLYTLLIYD